jgi:ubiquinone biosynthesis protein
MNLLNLPLVVFFTVLTVLAFAAGIRRLLGIRLSATRTIIAGVIAFLLAGQIITAFGRSVPLRRGEALPALWFEILGVVIATVIGMVFVVVAEALVPSGSLPGPVYIARAVRMRIHRIRRYAQISRILMRHGLVPYLRGSRRSELTTAEGRARLAEALRLALDDGGVTFIKLGQMLSTRQDLLPAEFTGELSMLQDRAAGLPWPQVERELRAGLGGEPGEFFAEFSQVPIAAASIAQVHTARLASGGEVAVKVRRPGIETVVAWDLDIVARVAATLQRRTRWGRAIGAVELAKGFAAALREELDLRIEARNMAAVAAANGRPGVRVPVPHQPMCTERVLVMERLRGVPLAAAGPQIERRGLDRAALARTLFGALLRQVMLDGVFHADPHPGNILLLQDGELGLLDFGSVGRLDAGLRAALQRLLLAIDRGDPVSLADALLEVVGRPDGLDLPRLERALGQFTAQHLGAGGTADAAMFAGLFRIVADHGLAVPPEIAAVFRALATAEGTLAQLSPGFDIVAEARAFASTYLASRFQPEALRQTAADELTMLLPMLRRLPRRVDRISAALEAGRLGISVRLLADERDRRVITSLLHQVLLTVLAATTGIMGVLMLGLHGGPSLTPRVSLYQFFGYCLLVVSSILALRVLVAVFRPDRG